MPVIQRRTKFTVGTSSTFSAYGLSGYLPGGSGFRHTPRLAALDLLAVAELVAGEVLAQAAVVRHDDADVADRDDGLRLRSRPWRTSG